MFKQTVCVLVFCLFFFSRTVSGDERDYQKDVDELINKGFEKAAVIGLDGNTYAASPEFALLPGEGTALVELFNHPNDAFDKGIQISGINYPAVEANLLSIYGQIEQNGVTCVRTKKVILIGVFNEHVKLGLAAMVVEEQAEQIRQDGY